VGRALEAAPKGGIPFFPQRERRVDLELVETRTFSSKVVYLGYRVAR
jgi:hypothetical protein